MTTHCKGYQLIRRFVGYTCVVSSRHIEVYRKHHTEIRSARVCTHLIDTKRELLVKSKLNYLNIYRELSVGVNLRPKGWSCATAYTNLLQSSDDCLPFIF